MTICTHGRASLFGEVMDGDMRLNDAGQAVWQVWDNVPRHYYHVQLDAFVVMPNHIHGILWIVDDPVGAGLKPAPTENQKRAPLSESIQALKTFSARRINEMRQTPGAPVWQRNYTNTSSATRNP